MHFIVAFLHITMIWMIFFFCRFTNQRPLGGHWTSLGSIAIMSYDRNLDRCSGSKGFLKTLKDQAGSLYLLTGRMMSFSLETIRGSKYLINQKTLHFDSCTLTIILFVVVTAQNVLLFFHFHYFVLDFFFRGYRKQPLYLWGRGKVCVLSSLPRPHFVRLDWVCCCCFTFRLCSKFFESDGANNFML